VLTPALEGAGTKRLGFEGSTVSVAQRDDLDERLDGVSLAATTKLVEDLRRRKDDEEVGLVRAAVELGDRTFDWVLDRIAPGIVERDLALDIEVRMRSQGADAVSFDPIVGSGELSAHIHHTAGDRSFKKGDLVLLDFGCVVDGYCSDLTRTVVLGSATDEQHRLYETVLASQQAGIEAVRAGVPGKDADAAARKVIEEAGHGDRFGHGLGHGVGLDVHEAPRLHRISEDDLAAGDIVTVEPGVYLQGEGGIRIEDCVLVTESGAEVLTSAPKDELIEL
jgi:Xaa-Pro aminopeptidase